MAVDFTGVVPELALAVDRSADVPLGQQVQEALRSAIRTGRMHSGERLPSTRQLADQLGVSRGLSLVAATLFSFLPYHFLAGDDKSERGDDDFSMETFARDASIDCVLPLIHGTGGEDGTLQGYLEILGLPYAGSGVTASAIGMDKGHMKQAFAAAKLPLVDYVQVLENDWRNERERILRAVNNALRLPYFVKPANGGSSVGVTKVKNEDDLGAAIEKAFRFDEKALVERGIDAAEIIGRKRLREIDVSNFSADYVLRFYDLHRLCSSGDLKELRNVTPVRSTSALIPPWRLTLV